MKECLNCKVENPDGARYCRNCGFTLDWSTTDEDTGEITAVLPSATLELAIGPAEVRLRVGQQVTLEVRIRNTGGQGTRATLAIAGPAAAYSTVSPAEVSLGPGATGEASVTVTVPQGADPGTVPLQLYATQQDGAGTSVSAQSSLMIEPPPATTPRRERTGGRRWVLPLVLALVAVALVLAVGLVVLSDDGGDGGVEGKILNRSSICVHRTPDVDPSSRIPDGNGCLGLDRGQKFRAECEQNDTVKLTEPDEVKGRFITLDQRFVQFPGGVPPCE